MRTLATLATTTLLLLFLANTPAYPQADAKPEAGQQQDEKNKDKKRPDDRKPEEPKNGERQNPAPNENRKPEASRPQEQRSAQEMNRGHQQHQAQPGKRIPDDKFRASFGRQHRFRVQRTQVVNTSQRIVVYGGYSFELVDAWPVEWGFDDDVYIDYVDGGYFLFDPLHPSFRIAVFMVE